MAAEALQPDPFAALGDEPIERTRPIERHQARHGLAVIGHRHLLALANQLQVPAEVITEFANTSFHPASMALFIGEISPH